MRRRRVLTWLPPTLVVVPALVLAWLGFQAIEAGETATRQKMRDEIDAAARDLTDGAALYLEETLARLDLLAREAAVQVHREAPDLGLALAVRRAEAHVARGLYVPDARIRVLGPDGRRLYPRLFVPPDIGDDADLLDHLRRDADRRYYGGGGRDAAIAFLAEARDRFPDPVRRAVVDVEIARLRLRAAESTLDDADAEIERLAGHDRLPGVGRAAVLLWIRAAELGSIEAGLRLAALLREGLTDVALTDGERRAARELANPTSPRSFDLDWRETGAELDAHGEPRVRIVADAWRAHTVTASIDGIVEVEVGVPVRVLRQRTIEFLDGGHDTLPVVAREPPRDLVGKLELVDDAADGLVRPITIPFLGPLHTDVVVPPDLVSAWRGEIVLVLEHEGAAAFRDGHKQRFAMFSLGVLGLLALVLQGVWLTRRAVKREQDALALRDEFIQNVTHEVRTPLTSVLMHAEMLAGDDLDPARRAAYGRVVEAEGARLAALVDDLLDFAALERGQRELEPEPLDLVSAAEHAVAPFLVLAEREGVEITVDVPESVVLALADPHAVARILANLMGNAWKHGRPSRDGAAGRLSLVAGLDGAVPFVEVKDDGPGIRASERGAVFERFGRGRDASGKPGAGLGLALSRDLARAMDGDLSVAEVSDETVFHLRLKPVEP